MKKKKSREGCKMYCVGNDASYDFEGQEKITVFLMPSKG